MTMDHVLIYFLDIGSSTGHTFVGTTETDIR